MPQIVYGIGGFEFDLQARKKPLQSTYGTYGGYYGHSLEPNAVGVYVTAHATPDSVTFNTINLGFGDSDLLSVKVNYQACNIGPSVAAL